LIFIFVSIVPLLFLSMILINSVNTNYLRDKKTEMFRQANTIALNLSVSGFFEDTANRKEYINIIQAIADGRTLIFGNDGTVLYDTNGIETGKLYATEEVISALSGTSNYYDLYDIDVGKVIVPIYHSDGKEVLGAVMLTSSLSKISDSITDLRGIAISVIIILIMLIIILSFISSGLITSPFRKFIKYMMGIMEGHITEKSTITGNYEIQQICTSFNQMIQRLWEVDESRQQFVANVSHELKTPLSSIKVLAESLLNQGDAPVELYKEFLEDINNEVDRESKIINDLLTLVSLDKKEVGLNITTVNVNKLVESIMKRLKPLADKKNIQMIFESFRTVEAEIDETKMTLAISNLIDNAIKYNKEFGLIKVTLNCDHKEGVIHIKDTGIGIPQESIDKIFNRFYRVDKTRSRDTGGTGLGLSIVKQTISMHHGSIRCKSELDKGTRFIIRIPLKYIS